MSHRNSPNPKNLFLLFLSIASVWGIWGCQTKEAATEKESSTIDPVAEIRRANVVYDSAAFQTGYAHVPPYIANGILGGCFDHMGFQSRPNKGIPEGRTVLGYIDQYYMNKETTRQAQIPLAYIQAGFADGDTILNMMEAKDYRQELDIYTGTLTTEYDLYGQTKITAFAHQTIPNLFVMEVDRQAVSPEKELVLRIHCETSGSQNANIKWKAPPMEVSINIGEGQADITSKTNMTTTNWSIIAEGNEVRQEGDQVVIRLTQKESLIRFYVQRDEGADEGALTQSFEDLLASHTVQWEADWAKSWASFPTERAHNIWTRANYYNLSNFPIIPGKALIPTGMNGNIWGFTFPQDVYYVAENLTRTNHFERYEKSMQYWLDILPEVKKYSMRTMDVEGGFYPWTPPFDQWDEFEKNGVVGNDSYEIHNPAYVSAMVWHYYQRTGDKAFLQEYFPIMEEVWRFYTNVIHPNDKGTFDVDHHKAAGQDEASRLESAKNLLCASYSAEYSARNYLKAAKLVESPEAALVENAETILEAGFEREALLNDKGYFVTYEGDTRPQNSQKHPVQLNAITFVPMADLGEADPSLAAWENRYRLTRFALKPVSHGWTYGAFTLASSRLREVEGMDKDLSGIQYFAGADPRWIQFYEFTFWERITLHLSYYFPTQGLYQQAFTDALVSDWRGYLDLFPTLLPQWKDEKLAFQGFTVDGGTRVDGEWVNGKFKVTLHPGWQKTIEVRVSQPVEGIRASGQQEGPATFDGNETVSLTFDGDTPVVLEFD